MRSLRCFLLLFFAVSVQAQVSVSIDLSTPNSPAIAGTQLDFNIFANNEGPADAANVEVDTSVPSGTTFVAMSIPAGWSCSTLPAAGGTGAIVCTTPVLTPSSAQLVLSVATPPGTPIGTNITLNATISTTSNDVSASDNSASLTVPVDWQANVTIATSAPATAFSGQTISYVINVTNNGPSYAANVSVTDTLPAQTTFVSVNAPGWSCSGTSTVTCTMAQLALTTSTITIQASTAPSFAGGTITNDVSVSSDSMSRTNVASASTNVTPRADLSIAKSGAPSSPVAGQNLVFTITVTNSGPSDATNVTMTDTLPPQVSFVSDSAPAGWNCSGTSTVTCTNADFAPGGSAQITITTLVSPATPLGTQITNTASVTSATPDPTTPNTATFSGTTATASDVALTAFSAAPNPVIASHTLTYSISLLNNGPSNANASLTIPLPSTLSLVSMTPPSGWSCSGTTTVTCTNASLAAGVPQGFTLATTVAANAAPGSTISVTATGTSTSDINPSNNSMTAVTNVISPATLSGTKTANGPFFETAPFSYTITLTNSGPAAQNDNPGNELVDVLPSSLTLVSAAASSGAAVANTGTNTVTWNGSIAAGGSVTVTIVATPKIGTAGTTISNSATINFDADGNGTNESTATAGPVTFTPQPAAAIPAMSMWVLLLLAAALAVVALECGG